MRMHAARAAGGARRRALRARTVFERCGELRSGWLVWARAARCAPEQWVPMNTTSQCKFYSFNLTGVAARRAAPVMAALERAEVHPLTTREFLRIVFMKWCNELQAARWQHARVFALGLAEPNRHLADGSLPPPMQTAVPHREPASRVPYCINIRTTVSQAHHPRTWSPAYRGARPHRVTPPAV